MNVIVILGLILFVWGSIGTILSIKLDRKRRKLEKLLKEKRGKRVSTAYIEMNEAVKHKRKKRNYKKPQNSTPKHKNEPTKSSPVSGGQKKASNEGENQTKKRPYRKNSNKKRYYYKKKKKTNTQNKKETTSK
jgi:hypothetical protein